jgi:glycosyltransferase involved in cell wall biosynthesis
VHNFRLVCAIGVAYRDGAPCHRCHAANTVPGLVHRCRGGVAEAAVYAAGLARQQRRLLAAADALVVLGQAHQAGLSRFGLAVSSAHVLPNFAASSVEATAADAGKYALVAGRLVPEKGFDTAILAAKAAGVRLLIAGRGPDEARLRALARGGDVRFAGWLPEDELGRVRAGAAVALAPSRWEEVCPYAVIDALAAGLPTLVSDRGGLPEMVGAGSVLPAGDTAAWASRLADVFADPSGRRSSGEAALRRARERFGAAGYLSRLLEIYAG